MIVDEVPPIRTSSGVARSNRRAVLEELVLHGPLARAEIAARVGLTVPSVWRIARGLLDSGLVRESAPGGNGAGVRAARGRPATYLDIAADAGLVLGIGIGPTIQTVTLSDLKNRVIAASELKLERLDAPDLVIRRVAGACRRLIEGHVPDRRRVLGCYLMITGTVDPAAGRVLRSRYLGWQEVALGERLEALLGLPVKVETMPVAVALAETRFGAARGCRDALVLLCALGLGAGLVVNGHPVAGRGHTAGAIGLVPVAGEDGDMTTLDRIAGGYGIVRRLNGGSLSSMPSNAQAEALLSAIGRDRDGDPAMAALMAGTGRALGRAAAQYALLLAPEVVVVAGPLSLSPRYVEAARSALHEGVGSGAIDVAASAITGPVDGLSATCGLAICEYLFERAPDLDGSEGAAAERLLPDALLARGDAGAEARSAMHAAQATASRRERTQRTERNLPRDSRSGAADVNR